MYKIPATTLFFGQNLIFMPECHSTNSEMLLLCQKDTPAEGTVIITSQQTAGRGQRGNTWEAHPGKNLTFTLLLKPAFLPLHKQFYLNIFTSLGICDYLTANAGLKVQIKWPNDIIANDRKIAGILIESQISGTAMTQSIVGTGFNVNQNEFGIPSATSLRLETGNEFDLSDCLGQLLAAMESRYLQLRNGKYDQLLEAYLERMYLLGTRAMFSDNTGLFEGTITGIDPTGRLIVSGRGKESSYDLKEIRYEG